MPPDFDHDQAYPLRGPAPGRGPVARRTGESGNADIPPLDDLVYRDAAFDRLIDDYRNAVYCRQQAEHYRDQWTAGRDREIDQVIARARAGDNRFRRLTDAELATIGRVRWSRSALAGKYLGREEMYLRWSGMYLGFAEFRLRLVTSRRDQARQASPALPELPTPGRPGTRPLGRQRDQAPNPTRAEALDPTRTQARNQVPERAPDPGRNQPRPRPRYPSRNQPRGQAPGPARNQAPGPLPGGLGTQAPDQAQSPPTPAPRPVRARPPDQPQGRTPPREPEHTEVPARTGADRAPRPTAAPEQAGVWGRADAETPAHHSSRPRHRAARRWSTNPVRRQQTPRRAA